MNSNTFIQEIKDDSRYLCPRCDQRDSILFFHQSEFSSFIHLIGWWKNRKKLQLLHVKFNNNFRRVFKPTFKRSDWWKFLRLPTNQKLVENFSKRNFHIFLTMKQRWFMDVLLRFGEFYFWNFGKENNLNYRNHFQFLNIFIRFRSNSSDRKLCRIEFSFLTVVVICRAFEII